MEKNNRSGLRELQIAQGLVALRWVAIPVLFIFGVLATRFLGMTLPITPIYVLACILAIINVYFTIHISMLSRQLALKHGVAGVKRFIGGQFSLFVQRVHTKGFLALGLLPKVILRFVAAIYLITLEALKNVPFNVLSLGKVMHCQVLLDIISLTIFIRFTGTSESPLLILLAIPIIVSGAVMGFFAGGVYAILSSLAYLILCLLINFRLIPHLKFYGPQFGDLSQSLGWTVSSFLMLIVGLMGTAYLAHNLTSIFKERIFYLNRLLTKNRREGIAQGGVANNVSISWFILDSNGMVLKYKAGKSELFPPNLSEGNLLEVIPAFRQHGLGYVFQSVLTSQKPKDIGRIKIQSDQGVLHTVTCRVLPIIGDNNMQMVLLMVEDITEIVFLKERVNYLKEDLEKTRSELEKQTLEAKEANLHLVKALKQANERSTEIAQMTAKIRELDGVRSTSGERIGSLMNELAGVKASNDTLAAELKYKQMILEEIIELLKNCTKLDQLTTTIERRTKALFKLDNACLHVFENLPSTTKMEEILDTRKISPKLLDLPRKNPKVLDPVINSGKPVVILAAVNQDQSASVAISNGNMRRMVAYIPVRHGKELLGMMMLDRYGNEDNTEKLLEMLVYYLGHTAFALKNALSTRSWEQQKGLLNGTIEKLEADIFGLMGLINSAPSKESDSFYEFLSAMKNLTQALDGVVYRFHKDGSTQILSRLDAAFREIVPPMEDEIIRTLKNNPSQKITLRENGDGKYIMGYPLQQGNQLSGVLIMIFTDFQTSDNSLLDIVAKLAAEHLALLTLLEEKELWENFFQNNLKA